MKFEDRKLSRPPEFFSEASLASSTPQNNDPKRSRGSLRIISTILSLAALEFSATARIEEKDPRPPVAAQPAAPANTDDANARYRAMQQDHAARIATILSNANRTAGPSVSNSVGNEAAQAYALELRKLQNERLKAALATPYPTALQYPTIPAGLIAEADMLDLVKLAEANARANSDFANTIADMIKSGHEAALKSRESSLKEKEAERRKEGESEKPEGEGRPVPPPAEAPVKPPSPPATSDTPTEQSRANTKSKTENRPITPKPSSRLSSKKAPAKPVQPATKPTQATDIKRPIPDDGLDINLQTGGQTTLKRLTRIIEKTQPNNAPEILTAVFTTPKGVADALVIAIDAYGILTQDERILVEDLSTYDREALQSYFEMERHQEHPDRYKYEGQTVQDTLPTLFSFVSPRLESPSWQTKDHELKTTFEAANRKAKEAYFKLVPTIQDKNKKLEEELKADVDNTKGN